MTALPLPVTIRPASAEDAPALVALAALDSAAAVPAAPVLVAEVEGELRAAMSLWDGRAIADPFHPTADLVELLRDRIRQSRRRPARRRAELSAGWSARRGRPASPVLHAR